MNSDHQKSAYRLTIPVGTQYYRQPTPTPSEWEEDFQNIKEMGMNLIQIRPQWRWHERQEGIYRWDDIDKLLELAEKAKLKVIFKFMLETAPDYVYHRYKGYRIGLQGERIWPRAHGAFFVGGWMPCFDHPDVMAHALAFVHQAVQRYHDRDVICLWHAWNEPRFRPMGECTCPYSLETYHQWLKNRFNTIERLNKFTGKCWGCFEDIDCPRDTGDFTEMHLWRQWAASRVAWRVEQVVKAIKGLDKAASQGAYHLFWQAGIQVDLVSSHEFGRINEYPVVYLPTFIVIDESRAGILRDYVAKGGKLLADGRIGQRDGLLGFIQPGPGLKDLFGLIEIERSERCGFVLKTE